MGSGARFLHPPIPFPELAGLLRVWTSRLATSLSPSSFTLLHFTPLPLVTSSWIGDDSGGHAGKQQTTARAFKVNCTPCCPNKLINKQCDHTASQFESIHARANTGNRPVRPMASSEGSAAAGARTGEESPAAAEAAAAAVAAAAASSPSSMPSKATQEQQQEQQTRKATLRVRFVWLRCRLGVGG